MLFGTAPALVPVNVQQCYVSIAPGGLRGSAGTASAVHGKSPAAGLHGSGMPSPTAVRAPCKQANPRQRASKLEFERLRQERRTSQW